jgi:uncharacterized protein YceK
MRLLLAAAILTLLTGCATIASMGSSRETVDLQQYSMCLRTGGQWWPDEQFGGNCLYETPGFK